jgi:SpoVK/Ycf46/Vps4 family AAA+-type ATPase
MSSDHFQAPKMPPQPTAVLPSADDATADDLIFLLSIVGNPNRIIAEQEKKQQSAQQQHGSSRSTTVKVSKSDDNNSPSSWWQSVLATLPSQRRQVIMALQELANTYQKWSQHSLANNNDRLDDRQSRDISSALEEIGTLEKLEQNASNIREYITSYLESIKDYKHAIQLFWINHITSSNSYESISQLSQIGYLLSSQLVEQLSWDEELAQKAITQLLNEELYRPNHETIVIHKLNTWASALSSVIQIDKSFWKFVEREVYDETELENNNEHPQLLNGEASSQVVDLETVTKSKQVEEQVEDRETCTNSCEHVSKQTMSLHEGIVKSSSVEEAVQEFFNYSPSLHDETNRLSKTIRKRPPITSILVTGQEGCGKTHLLDTIQRQQRQQPLKETDTAQENHHSSTSVRIIRPKYPVDLVGSSIGSSEDRLIALFSYAYDIITTCKITSSSTDTYTKCLVMLDDIDKLLSLSDEAHNKGGLAESSSVTNSAHYFVGRRCKALFLTILDSLREKYSNNNGHILLLCTSRLRCEEIVSRFDKVFGKCEPDDDQRREMILSCLAADNREKSNELEQQTDDAIDELLSLVVHHATGKSAFEISQCCGKVLLACAEASSSNDHCTSILRRRLECLDNMIQSAPPPSLHGGSLDGVVDMRVLTPEELESRVVYDSDGKISLPLFGLDAKRAYESLMNVVITPLCRSNDIAELLYGGNAEDTHGSRQAHIKPIRVGALLVGGPGVGKTSLAYHCASVAASMARGVTLLDVSCNSLIHKELGGSERAVRQLFSAVRAAAPCILLLDGIENIAPCRGNDNTTEGTMDRVLSMFLTEMDGIETGKPAGNVAVIGITYDANLIDPSLRRPGRLEKTIPLGMPDTEARKELVMRGIRSMNLDFTSADYFDPKNEEELSNFVAIESAGMSAVEVIAICKETSMECLREVEFNVTDPTEPPSLRYKHFKCAVNKMKGR